MHANAAATSRRARIAPSRSGCTNAPIEEAGHNTVSRRSSGSLLLLISLFFTGVFSENAGDSYFSAMRVELTGSSVCGHLGMIALSSSAIRLQTSGVVGRDVPIDGQSYILDASGGADATEMEAASTFADPSVTRNPHLESAPPWPTAMVQVDRNSAHKRSLIDGGPILDRLHDSINRASHRDTSSHMKFGGALPRAIPPCC